MYADLPEFKRCCLCIPLRYGLLAWGYIKLAITLFLLSLITTIFIADHHNFKVTFVASLIFVSGIMELAFNVVFVFGAHKKNEKLLKIYLYYSIVGVILFLILTLINLGSDLYIFISGSWMGLMYIVLMSAVVATSFLQILLQFYLILLVRSEIKKLSNGHAIEFVNVAVDSVCNLMTDKELTMQEGIETMD